MNLDPKHDSKLDRAMTKALDALLVTEVTDAKFASTVDQIAKLQKMKHEERRANIPFSPDVLLTVGANLVGIIMVLKHERANYIASKAMSLLLKPRS